MASPEFLSCNTDLALINLLMEPALHRADSRQISTLSPRTTTMSAARAALAAAGAQREATPTQLELAAVSVVALTAEPRRRRVGVNRRLGSSGWRRREVNGESVCRWTAGGSGSNGRRPRPWRAWRWWQWCAAPSPPARRQRRGQRGERDRFGLSGHAEREGQSEGRKKWRKGTTT